MLFQIHNMCFSGSKSSKFKSNHIVKIHNKSFILVFFFLIYWF